jgi:hypothetical protein
MANEPWHLSKSVPLSIIFAVIAQTVTLVWFIAGLNASIDKTLGILSDMRPVLRHLRLASRTKPSQWPVWTRTFRLFDYARTNAQRTIRCQMPYSSPSKVPSNVPEPKRRQFMEVFNSVYSDTQDEGRAMAAAYSAITKAQYANDIFTTEMEARARSMDMGLGGEIHVHEYDGQAVFMPAESHEDYLAYYGAETEDDPSVDRMEALRVVIQEILKEDVEKAEYQGEKVTLNKPRRIQGGNKKFEVFVKDGDKVKRVTFGDPNMEIRRDDPKARANFRSRHSCDTATDKTSARYWSCRMWEADTSVSEMTKTTIEGKILKADDEQRMVYGWASVVTEKGEPVIDRQGDVIEPDTLVKAVNNFMEHVRVGKAMHTGDQVGVVVHSMPITKEIGDALGIHSDREGWVVAYKVYDDNVWNMVKSGELAAFSIGGRAVKEDY